MSLWYKFLYQIGVTPWEEDPTKGAAAEQISALFDRAENERQPPLRPSARHWVWQRYLVRPTSGTWLAGHGRRYCLEGYSPSTETSKDR